MAVIRVYVMSYESIRPNCRFLHIFRRVRSILRNYFNPVPSKSVAMIPNSNDDSPIRVKDKGKVLHMPIGQFLLELESSIL